jgi:protein O-GlcNAc transferase
MLELLNAGEMYFENSDFGRAAECFRQAYDLAPQTPFGLVGLGRVALAMGKLEEAVMFLDSALKKAPTQPQALVFRGVAAEAAENLGDATKYYGPAHFHKGRVFAQQHLWTEAKDSLGLARQLMPDIPETHSMFATALFRCGDTEGALRVLGEAAQQNPNHVDTLATLVDVLVENRQYSLAKSFLENALERLPHAGIFANKLAAIALRENDMVQARVESERIVAMNPNDEASWLFAATLDMTALDFDTAEKRLQGTLKLFPQSWKAHYQLGVLYDALHWPREAQHEYEMAAQFNASAWEPLNNLGILLLEDDSPKGAQAAKTVLEKCVKLVPQAESIKPLYNLALAHVKLGEKPQARVVLARAQSSAKPSEALGESCRKLAQMCA